MPQGGPTMIRSYGAAALITAAVLVATMSTAVSAQPVFGECCARYDFPVTGAPRAIAAADLSGDGWTDLVLAGTAPGSVTVLTSYGYEDGDEGQRFRAKDYAVGGGPFELALADLNRDGWIDIAVANADANAVTLLFNDRRGQFGSPVNLPLLENPRGIAIGDFNRDAIPDIVATKFMGSTVEVLYGAGDGTFPRRLALQAPVNSQGATAGDFDHDGWGDFAVASASGTVRVYKMFATGAVIMDLNPAGVGWNVIAASDLDRDGRQDLAVASTGSSVVQVLYNRASGWMASPQIPVAASPRGIAIADLDRNATGEIVVAGRAASMITIITRSATGTFSTSNVPAGSGARTVALADFDNSGGPDIATANEFGRSTTIWYNRTPLAPAGFVLEKADLPWPADPSVLGVADFNHNGKPDIVRPSYVFLDGTTQSRYLGYGAINNFRHSGGAGDFNRDGNPDVVYSHIDRLEIFWGNGKGQFTNGPITSAPGAGGMRVADLNRDGRSDLVVSRGGSQTPSGMDFYLATGDGTFARSSGIDGSWRGFAVADLDRDGVVDVVATPTDGGVAAYLGDGRGGIKATKVSDPGVIRFSLAVGDLSGDGVVDLAAVDPHYYSWGGPFPSGKFSVLHGLGDGTFEFVHQYDSDDARAPDFHSLYSLMIGDVTGEGYADVFTGHGELYAGSGLGAPLADPVRFDVQSVGSSGALADLNGDGLLDILGFNYTGGGAYSPAILYNTARTENRPPSGLTMPDRISWRYDRYYWDTDENYIDVGYPYPVDPDLHRLTYRWTLADGTVVSTFNGWTPKLDPGTYQVTVTISDGQGGSASETFTLDVPPYQEIVLTTGYHSRVYGAWQSVADPTAAEGRRLWHPNAGAPKQVEPLANPTNFFEVQFVADPTQEYKLWIRMKAEGNYWGNDSVFVQFTGAKDAAGNPIYEIGTPSALAVNLEECSGCGVSGWGWEDDGWGAVNRNGTTLRFPQGGPQTLRIQTREDGVSIDEIVLSAVKYKTSRPGTAKNDTTILPHGSTYLMPPPR
jgi:hypothetical protein